MVRSRVSFAFLACLFLASATPVSAAVRDFVGVWKNADPGSQGLVEVDIRRDSGGLVVHAIGKCRPTDCGWGQARASLLAPRSGLPAEANADAAFVEFVRGGLRRVVVLAHTPDGLSFQTYAIFKNGSRPSYHDAGRMVRP